MSTDVPEFSAIKGSATWKSIIVYKNVLRATDNIGVNAAWVIKFYLKGNVVRFYVLLKFF